MSAASRNLKSWPRRKPICLTAHRHSARNDSRRLPVSRNLTAQRSELRCPHCESVVYPAATSFAAVAVESCRRILFTAEAERLENLLRTEQRHENGCGGASRKHFGCAMFSQFQFCDGRIF